MPAPYRFLIPTFLLIGSLPGLCGTAGPSSLSGEFLFRTGGSGGGITGVDASGSNYFGIIPPSGFGNFGPVGTPDIKEFTQARANGRIAFSSGRDSNDSWRIYVINGDGTGLRQVTFHDPKAGNAEPHSRPAISPDGSKIAYINGETIAPPGTISGNGADCSGQETQGVWMVNADGTNPHLVKSQNWSFVSYCNAGSIFDVGWSADGTKLVVKDAQGDSAAGCKNEILLMNADGSGQSAVSGTCNNWDPANVPHHGLDWSPDGTKLIALIDSATFGSCGGNACPGWFIWDTSTWDVITTIADTQYGDAETRFSPDSRLFGISAHLSNGHGGLVTMDLSGNQISSIDTYYSATGELNTDAGALWWGAANPGTLASMTVGVPAVYVNACPNYSVWLQPSVYNTAGALVTHGYTGLNVANNSAFGDNDSWVVDAFGFAAFVAGRSSGGATVQLTNMAVASNAVPLTSDQNCTCQTSAGSSLSVTRSGLRYVASSQQQFVQTVTVKNNTMSPVSGPINIVIENLTGTVTLTNLSGTSGCAASGSPYMTVVPSGSALGAGQSSTVTLYFRDPSLNGFTYSTAVTAGAGAP